MCDYRVGRDGRRGLRAGNEGLRGEELTSGIGHAKDLIEEWGVHPWGECIRTVKA